MNTYRTKYTILKNNLSKMGSVVVAFSGGVDSSVLAAAAHEALGDKALAVSALSPTYQSCEFEMAKKVAQQLGAKHITIESTEMSDSNFCSNPKNRCYYCKTHLFTCLQKTAKECGMDHVIEGSNIDDLDDYRPGRQAIKELGIKSPLMDAGITKKEVREIAKHLNLPVWDKPAQACLSSRIPYGETITEEKVNRVANAEKFLRDLGFNLVRVRDYNELAKIEVAPDKIQRLRENMFEVEKKLIELGYEKIEIDPKGYRMGAMNEALSPSLRGMK